MGVGGLITGIMGATGSGPSVSVPTAASTGTRHVNNLNQFVRGLQPQFNAQAQFAPQYAQLNTNMFANALPQTISALRSASPAKNLWDQLSQSASEQLQAGANLDPALQRVTTQAIRGSQAARGLGFGPADALQESTALTQLGNSLRQQRQAFGLNVAQGVTGAETMPAINQAQTAIAGAAPSIVPGGQLYDMYNTLFNAQSAANIQNANLQAGLLSGFNSMD